MNNLKIDSCRISLGFGSKKTSHSLQYKQSESSHRLPALGNIENTVKTLKAIANSERLLVLFFLAEGDKIVSQISNSLSISQEKLSNQLMILKAANLVIARRQGKRMFYSLKDRKIREFVIELMLSDLVVSLSEKGTCKAAILNE